MSLLTRGLQKAQTLPIRGMASGSYIKMAFAVEGMTFEFIDENHSGEVTITGAPSTKVRKIPENKWVYKDKMSISIANGSDGATTDNATGSGVIDSSAIKEKVEGVYPLREEDKNNIPIIMTGTNRNPPPTVMTYTTLVKIKDAGQDKSKGV